MSRWSAFIVDTWAITHDPLHERQKVSKIQQNFVFTASEKSSCSPHSFLLGTLEGRCFSPNFLHCSSFRGSVVKSKTVVFG